ncbi:hypothetical protein [Chroococcus sp. FPU101]|uniref:hypothetical protein n=1 Tax=Chroococcus sp. FPU101 TaxID=1974212 RepID=UPI001A8D179A|nr:hypothetical protein [Chroococcus sp. FPU101]GFE69102.1 hypothetical protein CFPU101_17120 [Chroococcus sp. FPU101]
MAGQYKHYKPSAKSQDSYLSPQTEVNGKVIGNHVLGYFREVCDRALEQCQDKGIKTFEDFAKAVLSVSTQSCEDSPYHKFYETCPVIPKVQQDGLVLALGQQKEGNISYNSHFLNANGEPKVTTGTYMLKHLGEEDTTRLSRRSVEATLNPESSLNAVLDLDSLINQTNSSKSNSKKVNAQEKLPDVFSLVTGTFEETPNSPVAFDGTDVTGAALQAAGLGMKLVSKAGDVLQNRQYEKEVADLAQRLDQAQERANRSVSRIVGLKKAGFNLETDLDEQNSSNDPKETQKATKESSERLTEASPLQPIADRLDEVNQKVSGEDKEKLTPIKLDPKQDVFEQLDLLKQMMDKIEQRLDQLEQRLDKLEQQIRQIPSSEAAKQLVHEEPSEPTTKLEEVNSSQEAEFRLDLSNPNKREQTNEKGSFVQEDSVETLTDEHTQEQASSLSTTSVLKEQNVEANSTKFDFTLNDLDELDEPLQKEAVLTVDAIQDGKTIIASTVLMVDGNPNIKPFIYRIEANEKEDLEITKRQAMYTTLSTGIQQALEEGSNQLLLRSNRELLEELNADSVDVLPSQVQDIVERIQQQFSEVSEIKAQEVLDEDVRHFLEQQCKRNEVIEVSQVQQLGQLLEIYYDRATEGNKNIPQDGLRLGDNRLFKLEDGSLQVEASLAGQQPQVVLLLQSDGDVWESVQDRLKEHHKEDWIKKLSEHLDVESLKEAHSEKSVEKMKEKRIQIQA